MLTTDPISITISVRGSTIDEPIHAAHLHREDGKYVVYFKYRGTTYSTRIYEHMSLEDVQGHIDEWSYKLNEVYERSVYVKQHS